MPTPSIQTLRADAQQVLNLDSISAVRSVVAATLANANAGTPLNPNLTTQQLWNEFYQIVTQPKSDIESIIANQLMKFLYAPPAPGGAGADKQVIFNDGGVLAGDPQFLWNKTTNLLTVTGSATITGDLTVDTSTLKVDSANNRVGIGTASPSKPLEVYNTTESTVWANTTTGIALLRAGGTGGDFYFGIDNSTGGGFGQGNYSRLIYSTGAYPIVFSSNASERYRIASDGVATWSNVGGVAGTAMTLNSTGLGVGRIPSTYKFEVSGNAQIIQTNFLDVALRISQGPATTGNKSQVIFTDSTGTLSYITGYGSAVGAGLDGMLALGVGGSDRVFISTTGNVGIGVLPSAWVSTFKAINVSSYAAFGGNSDDKLTLVGNNYYNDGTAKFIGNGYAGAYSIYQGAHRFQISTTNNSSGAGAALTFTQAMTLDASGNLLVGTTSSPSGAKVGAITKLSGVSAEGTAAINVSTTPVAISRNTGVCGLFFVMGYNASGGAQGWYLVASTGSGTPTVISSGGTPGLTLTFTMAGGQLNAQTASGTFVSNVFSITA